MPLETATFTHDLVASNPAHTDPLSQADSHMRLLKSSILATFPNFTDVALASTQAQIDLAASVAAGTAVHTFPLGTAALPGLTPLGDSNTGIWSPAGDQLAVSIGGSQVLLMGTSALVTTLGIAAPAITSAGAYSGGTGQLVPIGAGLLWHDDVLPVEGGYAWANGQIIASANTVCPILLARWGSRYGGNGTTTMGMPDYRDTVPIGKSTMGGAVSRGLQTLTNTVLGNVLGVANVVLTTLNLPPYTPTGTVASAISNFLNLWLVTNGSAQYSGGTQSPAPSSQSTPTITSTFTGTAQGGTSTPVNNVQPSTTCNYIIRLA